MHLLRIAFVPLGALMGVLLHAEKEFEILYSNIGNIEVVQIQDPPSLTEYFEQSISKSDQSDSSFIGQNNLSDQTDPERVKETGIVDGDEESLPSKSLSVKENLSTQDEESAVHLAENEDSDGLQIAPPDQESVTGEISNPDNNIASPNSDANEIDPDALPFLTSDFFADSMSVTNAEEDPMGTQRLLQVKDSRFSPSLMAGTSYKYSLNPDKDKKSGRKNLSTLDLSIGFNLGLGEYGVGDYFVCAPAASLMQMRTFNDPIKKYDKDEMREFDADALIARLNVPLVLPNDYSLSFTHTYVAASKFREGTMINYSNSPGITLSKNVTTESGGMLYLIAGINYTFTEGDSYEEETISRFGQAYYEALRDFGNSNPNDMPANLQDGYTFSLSASYTMPISEKLSVVPSTSYQHFTLTEGIYDGRIDKTLMLGISVSYLRYEWLNFSLSANYTNKTSSFEDIPDDDDFIFSGGINVNHSF